jgi:hypothetical protein
VRTGAQLSVLNVVFENGCASDVITVGTIEDDRGGAIYAREASVTVRFSTFIGNNAFEGAAIFGLNSGDVTIVGSEMRDNIADEGVVEFENNVDHIPAGTVVVANNAIYDNNAGDTILVRSGDETWVVNNTLVSNEGAGVHLREDLNSVVLAHNTIAGNADEGLQINLNATGTIEIYGNVISGNDVDDGGLSDCVLGVVAGEARRNAFGINGNANGCSGFSVETNNIVPMGPLETILETTAGDPIPSANGGPTPTVRVPINSPTIDASAVVALPDETVMGVDLDLDGPDDPIDVDQRGAIRVVDAVPDMGATENLFSPAWASPVPAMAPGALALVGVLLGFMGVRTLRPR